MESVEEFLAYAIKLEQEAALRFGQLADAMATAGNREVMELFRRSVRVFPPASDRCPRQSRISRAAGRRGEMSSSGRTLKVPKLPPSGQPIR